VIGVLYELLGLLRFGGKWRIAAADLLFWALTCLFSFVFLLVVNGGEPRGFMLAGIAGGAALVRLTAGSVLHRLKLRAREARERRKLKRKRAKAAPSRAYQNYPLKTLKTLFLFCRL
jgi:hypothetical protein